MKWKVMPGSSTVRSPRPEAHGALAPVGRIGEADRIAGAVVLADAVPLEHGEEGVGDILAGVAGLAPCEPGLHAFQHRLLGVEEFLRVGLPRKTVRDSGQW